MKTYIFLLCFSMLALAGRMQAQQIAANRNVEPVPINLDSIKRVVGYPNLAKEAQIQGDVIAYLKVDSTGAVVKHHLVYSCHPIMERAVDAQISHLRFVPGRMDGKHHAFWVNIPFKFRMLGGKNARLSEPQNGGFFLLADGIGQQIENPFGTTYADILKKVGKNKVDGKRINGQVYFWVKFDAQGKQEDFFQSINAYPEIQTLVSKEIKRLVIAPTSPLLQNKVPFRIFVPFTFN